MLTAVGEQQTLLRHGRFAPYLGVGRLPFGLTRGKRVAMK